VALRKTAGYYELQGPIYVNDIMNGEAMAFLDSGECMLEDFELH
jgi:hypothetical protein